METDVSSGQSHVPVTGFGQRFRNIATKHYRGLVGAIVPLAWLCTLTKSSSHNAGLVWLTLAWLYAWQPVCVPVAAMAPVFMFPMFGVISTSRTASSYFTENTALFLLAGMLFMLMNNSGVDRRIALNVLCFGKASNFTSQWILIKSSAAAFFLSMFSNRLLVSSTITEYMTSSLVELQAGESSSPAVDAHFSELRHIVNNAIQTSASIGSVCVVTAAYTPMVMRAVFDESGHEPLPDFFNFLQYSAFALPAAVIMFYLNLLYHLLLLHWFTDRSISSTSRLMDNLINRRKAVMSEKTRSACYDVIAISCTFFAFMLLCLRWCQWFDGWATFVQPDVAGIAVIKDATVAAMLVLMFHLVPRSARFLRYATAKKKSDVLPVKPEPAILLWRFVNGHTNYGYMFVIGSGVALMKACILTGLDKSVGEALLPLAWRLSWPTGAFLVCLASVLLCHVMSGAAACAVLLPLVLSVGIYAGDPQTSKDFSDSKWSGKIHHLVVAVGMATSYGFMVPYLFTPAYFCHYVGKVPKKKMVKYALFSVFICLMVTYIMVIVWAPVVWNTDLKFPEPKTNQPTTQKPTTTAAKEA